ncbi:cupin domain-containing protein [Granulicella arctica]|uniref:Mannose-6-phosphate isomerase-like protein (Cupin superfamily) n=1 Tax=Granulicella arctica TaxID=940613 RepID=A0A7Y9PEK7_9BACT|nr:cupin domain-containing protein [Granulicella arctica]NYF78487.1 mannose-6-phosphate isomerase-like protein (cupin superfamily) [Granulicella arctica]
MPAKIISPANAEHYTWGNHCDGWFLVRTPELNIIEERLPPGTGETRHHHDRARQFFYVLEGELTMEIEYHDFILKASEGIEIAPGQVHQAANRSHADLRILVTSQPPSHGDRIED